MNRRSGEALWAAILAAAVTLGAASACGRAPDMRSGPAPSASVADLARPLLRIKSAQYDFGTVVQGELLRRAFELENAGSTRLELEGLTESLGCSGVLEPTALDPGAAGRLVVECHIELYGPIRVALLVRSKTDSEILGQVELSGSVTPLLAFDPPLLSVRLPFGEERIAEVRLQGALARQAIYTINDTGDAGFVAVSPRPGVDRSHALRLRVKGRKVGMHVGNLVARTNLARPREVSLPYSCEVVGTLEVTPSTPYFDLRAPGGLLKELTVRSSQGDFTLHSARVVEGPFTASFKPREANGEYHVLVSAQRDRLVGDARGTLGRLVLQSNDRAEPEKELPLFAFGALSRDPPE